MSYLQDTRQLFYHLNNLVNWGQCGHMIQFHVRDINAIKFRLFERPFKRIKDALYFLLRS